MKAAPLFPITAYGVSNALGADRQAVLSRLREGRHAMSEVPFPLPFPTVAGVVHASLPELPSSLAAWSNRPTRLALALVEQIDAPLARARARWRADRIGIVIGTSTSGADATERAFTSFIEQGVLPEDYDFHKQHTFGALVDVIAELTGITGPAWVVSTTCTSSAKPFGSARRLIQAGILDAVLVGGIDTLCSMTILGFHALGALSSRPSRPFSAERDGINIGEGGALLLVEREGEGPALLEAVGESSDAYHISAPHPEGLGAALAMQRALDEAGITAAQVDHINAHGTGTRLNDTAEGKAIATVFGSTVPVASTKGYTGHMLGAAGATECVLSIMSIEAGLVPASVGAEPLDPALTIDVATEARHGPLRRVLSNSFAFGGSNASVLMRAP